VKEIGRLLGISAKTVETHRQNLMDRLGITHVPGLVRYALRSGILPMSWLKEDD
jgi:DNA-binding CsgD family transcriptional regulator